MNFKYTILKIPISTNSIYYVQWVHTYSNNKVFKTCNTVYKYDAIKSDLQ